MSDILFADDDEALRRMVGELLRHQGHRVRLAANGGDALHEARRRAPDLVILDYRMGEPDGFAVCRALKDDPRLAHVPVLILTGQSAIEHRLDGFEAGADDYLAKPFDSRELMARVSALLRQTRRALDRNPTTGLPGGEAIEHELERRRAAGEPFAVVYFDLDDFKPFGDRFGFAVADAAIREAAGAVSTAAAPFPGVFAGHVGGDDFVLVCGAAEARALAEEARARFDAALRPHLPPEAARTGSYRGVDRGGVARELPVTRLSAAVVRVDPAGWTSLEAFGERVAEAKHRAKTTGGIAESEG
jgi:PleD family two-component response regulator